MNSHRPAAVPQDASLPLSSLAFFLVMTAYYIIRPVRDQLGGAVGSQSLPLFYIATFVVMLLLTPVFGALVARFPRRPLLGYTYGFFLLCLLCFVPAFMAQERIGARALGLIFYVWVSVFNLFVVSLFWSLMADLFDSVRARQAFPLIALGGMGGAIFGPLLTSMLVRWFGVAPLLGASAATLGLALLLLLRLSTRQDSSQQGASASSQPVGGSLWGGIKQLWRQPFLRYMAILMVLGDGIGTLAYALMADYTKQHYADRVARTAFYNDLDLVTNLFGAFLQLTFTRWLMIRRGAGWALVMPALVNLLLLVGLSLLGSTHLVFGVSMLTLTMIASRGFAYGMTKPAVDALYTRVPRETRYKGKNFVETAVWRFGDVLVTSGVSLLGKLGLGLSGMALIGSGVSMLAAWVAGRAVRAPDLQPESAADREDRDG